jgi:MFS family permease
VASAEAHVDRAVRFRDVLASGEYRAVYSASILSWIGDYVARAAIAYMVFKSTDSAAASAAAFAISYAPWLLGGSLLVAIAERYPSRRVMVVCDVARMIIMALIAISGSRLPLAPLLALLLLCSLFSPPFDAARSAMLPAMLGRERYMAGLALSSATAAPIQVAGYVLGSSLAAIDAPLALGLNAASFGVSAVLIRTGVRLREAGLPSERRTGLLRETGDGFRIVFGNPALRALVLLVLCGSLFAIVPEGLGAAWAAAGNPVGRDRAWAQGLLMGSVPAGMLLGSLTVGRLLRPSWRHRVLRPLAVLTPLALVPALFDPPVPVAAALALISGFAIGALTPVANAEFVQALPSAYRARAFGVVSAGLQLVQGGAVLATGALAQHMHLYLLVGAWSAAGVVLMIVMTVGTWPRREVFAEAGARAAEMDRSVRPSPAVAS